MKDKVIFITGASRGIGRSTAQAFAREQARLAISYHSDQSEGEKTRDECLELGAAEVLLLQLNVFETGSVEEGVATLIERLGKIDVLVNNAGYVVWRPLREQSLTEIEMQVRTNLEGLLKVTRVCLPHVSETIINIASGAGKHPHQDLTAYCASKYGVRGFTQALALEEPKLKIYCVNPGMTQTRMTGFQGQSPEKVAGAILKAAKGGYRVPAGGDIDV